MSNDTYLPVIEEKIKTKYPTEKGTDRLQIENSLYSIKNNNMSSVKNNDKCSNFLS